MSDTRATLGPSGIGGWLILPIIGFILAILLTSWNLIRLDLDDLAAIFAATSEPLVTLQFPFAASLVSAMLLIASAVYCLYLVSTRSHKIIRFATVHYLILIGATLNDLWVTTALETAFSDMPPDPTIIREAVQVAIGACIWISYFHVSKRVKNTFTSTGAALVAD